MYQNLNTVRCYDSEDTRFMRFHLSSFRPIHFEVQLFRQPYAAPSDITSRFNDYSPHHLGLPSGVLFSSWRWWNSSKHSECRLSVSSDHEVSFYFYVSVHELGHVGFVQLLAQSIEGIKSRLNSNHLGSKHTFQALFSLPALSKAKG